jgi:hypothetical protein
MRAQHAQTMQQWQPGPLEQAFNAEGLAWLNATSGKEPLDITKLPGMAPYLDIYNSAVAKQQGQRQGLGILSMGAATANPALLANLAQQEESHRRQGAAQQLSNAFNIRNAEVRGSALPLMNLTESRAAGRAGTAATMANAASNRWAQHQIRPGFWANMLDQVTRGAAQGATMAAAA